MLYDKESAKVKLPGIHGATSSAEVAASATKVQSWRKRVKEYDYHGS